MQILQNRNGFFQIDAFAISQTQRSGGGINVDLSPFDHR